MSPLLILAQRCGDCERRWLAITTLPETDPRCWYCGATDVRMIRPPPDHPPQSNDDPERPR